MIRVGVTHLLTTYQYLADTGKVERLAQLFAPDGVLEIGAETFTGPDEILGPIHPHQWAIRRCRLPARASSPELDLRRTATRRQREDLRVLPVHRHPRASITGAPTATSPCRRRGTAGGSSTAG